MITSTNKVAIVTGASRGIGAAIARRLASDGLTVVVNYAGSPDAAAKLVDEIEKAGGRATSFQADVSDPQAVRRMFDSAEAAHGGVDVLVNNAGIMKLAPVAQFDDATFDQTIAINLKGTFNGLREAARRLRDGGRIVNFSTSVVGLYQPTYGVYAATKAAVEALTHILAKELGSRAITVNAVAPGPVATELFLEGKDQATLDRIKQMNPLGRLGEVDDIARVVSLLVGPDSGWINGQIVRANGGVI
ncbi:SDR family oxidoreductase [Mesorhizobium sp. BR1-1-9]|uniref:SDR family oxidoreductase n=1 Tax=unclassified Mesorhizobium TaxID=325217 RepID=UPI0011280364|nr:MULTISPECIES: SDR family oxidoreductase [unclassified Mesorhizobium]MBZ9811348.1 SDR family oxidoreductase [Mesorhizobium sp. ESP-6-2]MBZ9811527.1 SDR family oxidoreductase [Mesorhizobium sp. ESP-6-2]MBZ9869347.1 SDR family oxidoreductase [Mesorhizobium sp. BR1-1-9]MBZ9940925.1 SDR family oxidoreductase [Mesorhizobium sp. BR1-1-13]TPM31984.1 SDR family oxidoreductase [Mesorhizobium sp. B2-2-2]